VRIPHHRQPGDAASGPGGLEIETAGDAIDVEAFAGEVEAGDELALHGAEVDFLQAHSATGDEFVFVRGLALNFVAPFGDLADQGIFLFLGELRPLDFWGNA